MKTKIYEVFVPTTKVVVSEHKDVKEANAACVKFNNENGGIAIVVSKTVETETAYTWCGNDNIVSLEEAVRNSIKYNGYFGVKGFEGVHIFVYKDRNDGSYHLKMFNIIGIGKTDGNDTDWIICKRLTKNAFAVIKDSIDSFIGSVELYLLKNKDTLKLRYK